MKQTIEIECPNGYKPVYNPDTKKVEIIPDNVMDRVKTYEDARRCLGYVKLGDVTYNGSINALAKLQTILEALNEGHKFKLLTGNVWYPWVRFYRVDSVPEGSKIVRYFSYQGEKFALVGGYALNGANSGLSCFNSFLLMGSAMPMPMSACLLVKIERLLNMYQLNSGNLYSRLAFLRISMQTNLNC